MGDIRDDGLERALREQLASDPVPADVVARARSAFDARATRSRLLPLEQDVVEPGEGTSRRFLTFAFDEMHIVLEVTGTPTKRHLSGSVTPGRVCAAFLRSEQAFAEIPVAEGRFECDVDASQVSVLVDVQIRTNTTISVHTDWFCT